jgi:hypothetical protein
MTLKKQLKPTSKKAIQNISNIIKLSKPSGNIIYRQAKHSEILRAAHRLHLFCMDFGTNGFLHTALTDGI